jgi:hypothetical protein
MTSGRRFETMSRRPFPAILTVARFSSDMRVLLLRWSGDLDPIRPPLQNSAAGDGMQLPTRSLSFQLNQKPAGDNRRRP